MTKKEAIEDPNSCWNKAHDNDIVFILIQKDPQAPKTIQLWAAMRVLFGNDDLNAPKITSALDIADKIDAIQNAKFDGTYPTEGKIADNKEKGVGY